MHRHVAGDADIAADAFADVVDAALEKMVHLRHSLAGTVAIRTNSNDRSPGAARSVQLCRVHYTAIQPECELLQLLVVCALQKATGRQI